MDHDQPPSDAGHDRRTDRAGGGGDNRDDRDDRSDRRGYGRDGEHGHGHGHDDGHGHGSTGPFKRLVGLLRPERHDIGIVVVFAVGVGFLTLATPVAVQSLVNFVSFGGMVQPLVVLGLLLLACLSLAAAMRAFKAYVVELLQRRLFVRVVTDLGHRLPRVRAEAFDREHGPELVNRFFDVLTVQKVGATLLLDAVTVVLQAGIGLLILAFYHPFLLAFDVVLLLAFAVILFGLGRGAVRTAIDESKAKYDVAGSLEEIARNPMTFKQAGGPDLARARADALAVRYVDARRQHFRVVLRQAVASLALQAAAATGLLTIGGWLVIEGQLTLGQLVAAELIVAVVLASFTKIGRKLESFYDLLAAVDKLGHLLDLPLERSAGEARQPAAGGAALTARRVGYAYGPGHVALSDLSLTLRPGERVCLVGGNGSGKSTLADLLCGVRAPTAGSIELDGVDVREISLASLRQHVAVVTGIEIIEGTVEENVRMSRPDVSADDARAALAAVGLLDEVRSMPDGLQTRLSATGGPLSYGQARLVMLARAMAGRPRLLVLDDVLDDLDARSRARVSAALLARRAGWTLIVLTHSDGVFGGADRTVRLPYAPVPVEPYAPDEPAAGPAEPELAAGVA